MIDRSHTARILELNQANVPHVGNLDHTELEWLLTHSLFQHATWDGQRLTGFILGLEPGTEYGSANYHWFCEHFPELHWFEQRADAFLYIDRLAVAADYRKNGLGQSLYAEAESYCRDKGLPVLTCEVNLEPLNQTSLDFHARLGFEEVGQLRHGPDKLVSLLAKAVD